MWGVIITFFKPTNLFSLVIGSSCRTSVKYPLIFLFFNAYDNEFISTKPALAVFIITEMRGGDLWVVSKN